MFFLSCHAAKRIVRTLSRLGKSLTLWQPARMNTIWLVVNPASGSFDAMIPGRLDAAAKAAGARIARTIAFPEHDLPSRSELEVAGVDTLVIHTGDGTINAAACRLAGWNGALLVLPGGTMNLLARRLHDDADAYAIFDQAMAGRCERRHITVIEGVDTQVEVNAFVGIFAGPTTAWGEVRETLRRLDIAALARAVPKAINDTFTGTQVRIEGQAAHYPAIYIEPIDGGLRVMGFNAAGAGELFSHGFAWLGGDFRDGPHDPLGRWTAIGIDSDAGEIGLLVDGERGSTAAPFHLRAAQSGVMFLATSAQRDAGR